MKSSLSRRLLPWTLLLCLAISAVILYLRVPKGEFEFDLSDARVAESPAAPSYYQIAERLWSNPRQPVELVFKSGLRYERYRFMMQTGTGITIDQMTICPQGNGAVVNEEPVSLKTAAQRLRDYCAAANAVSSVPVALHGPPDGTMRQWLEFFRTMDFPGLWTVPPVPYTSS